MRFLPGSLLARQLSLLHHFLAEGGQTRCGRTERFFRRADVFKTSDPWVRWMYCPPCLDTVAGFDG